jgi:pyruvate dehydrogenase E1 component alpha subunit
VKALGYGFPGVRVDGNDVLGCYVVTREALRRARKGEGPTLIEAVTYRRGPHSTADDATRYRTVEELKHWEALDPIARFEKYLEAEGVLTAEFKEKCDAEGRDAATKLRKEIVGAGPLDPALIFEHVNAERSPILQEEFEEFMEDQEGR